MDIVLLILFGLLIGPILGICGQLLTKIKIPYMIGLILIGLVFGTEGVYNFFGQGFVNDSIKTFTALVGINIVFFTGGYNMDLDKVLKAGKVTGQMVTLPVHVAAIISGIVGYGAFMLLGLNETYNMSLFGMLALAAPVAMGSLVLVVPTILSLKKPTENDLGTISIATSILDNYTILPFFLVMIVVGASFNSGEDVQLIGLITQLLVVAVTIAAVGAYGFGLGKIYGKLTVSLHDNHPLFTALSFAVVTVVTYVLTLISSSLAMFAIICALAFGIGTGSMVKKEVHPVLGATVAKGLGLFILPVIFVGIGASMRISQLLDVKMIAFMIIFAVASISAKMFVTKMILKKNGYNAGEQNIAMLCQFLYGAAAINMSIALVPFFITLGETDGPVLMSYLGVFLYIVCLPIGNYITGKYLDKWNA